MCEAGCRGKLTGMHLRRLIYQYGKPSTPYFLTGILGNLSGYSLENLRGINLGFGFACKHDSYGGDYRHKKGELCSPFLIGHGVPSYTSGDRQVLRLLVACRLGLHRGRVLRSLCSSRRRRLA